MSLRKWEKKILDAPGAKARIAEIEDELRLAVALTRLREQSGLSQRELAARMAVSQPRIAAIERCKNVTIEVLDKYVRALGAELVIAVEKGSKRIPLVNGRSSKKRAIRSRPATGKKRA